MAATLPSDAASWRIEAVANGVFTDQSLRDIPKMASASKVEYEDWLQLRILWKTTKMNCPTHESLFGKRSKGNPVEDFERTSAELLKSLPWYSALDMDSSNPLEWHAMALWKESVKALARRTSILTSQNEGYMKHLAEKICSSCALNQLGS
ncbi:hypothetical protein V8C37DRAFT_189756 [Trichoderma ceciliae]